MILVTELVGFSRAKYPPRARPYIGPYGHRLIKAADPPTYEHLLHVRVKLIDHLAYFPESILEVEGFFIREL